MLGGGGAQVNHSSRWYLLAETLLFLDQVGDIIAFSLSLPSGHTGRPQGVLPGQEKYFLQSCPVE